MTWCLICQAQDLAHLQPMPIVVSRRNKVVCAWELQAYTERPEMTGFAREGIPAFLLGMAGRTGVTFFDKEALQDGTEVASRSEFMLFCEHRRGQPGCTPGSSPIEKEMP
jgi:hypothetical protein